MTLVASNPETSFWSALPLSSLELYFLGPDCVQERPGKSLTTGISCDTLTSKKLEVCSLEPLEGTCPSSAALAARPTWAKLRSGLEDPSKELGPGHEHLPVWSIKCSLEHELGLHLTPSSTCYDAHLSFTEVRTVGRRYTFSS